MNSEATVTIGERVFRVANAEVSVGIERETDSNGRILSYESYDITVDGDVIEVTNNE